MSIRVAAFWRMRKAVAVVVFAFESAYPVVATSQSGSVSGRVVDSTGASVVGAQVVIDHSNIESVTGENGEFRLDGVSAGTMTIKTRRLGFSPDSLTVVLGARDVGGLLVRLNPIPAVRLRPVLVRASGVKFSGRLAGYYQRLDRKASGYFITRNEIDRDNPRTLTQLLQSVPGMSAFRGRSNASSVRMRGRNCWPLVWLDGSPMPSADVDLDGIPPNTIQGIELYLGSTTAPLRYTNARDVSSCGTILLWSRGPDTDPVGPSTDRPLGIETLIASHAVFTAEQVDRPAQLDSAKSLNISYPPSLFAERVSGQVVAEFVVGPTGRLEIDTFGIVSSTNRLFSEAVKQAVESAVFKPAMLKGQAVRQLVHQPFSFASGGHSTAN